MQIVIDPMALDELAEAAKWYSDKSIIAAENFPLQYLLYQKQTRAENFYYCNFA